MNQFAIIADPRSGSTALANFFRDLQVPFYYEPFRPDKWQHRKLNIYEELDHAYISMKVIGMKHVYTHLDDIQNLELSRWLDSHRIKVIRLVRKNFFMSVLSTLIAHQTGTWEIQFGDSDGEIEYQNAELKEIPISLIEEYIKTHLNRTMFLTEGSPWSYTWYTLVYEEMFGQTATKTLDEVHSLIAFIGGVSYELRSFLKPLVETMALTHFGASKKQNKPWMYERIPNWNEIKERFYVE